MFENQLSLFKTPSKLESYLLAEGGKKCSPMDLYTAVFRLGEGKLQTSSEAPGLYKTNPLIIGQSKTRMHRKILFEDTFEETLQEFSEYEWAYVSGCTYWGRTNSGERQSKLYALIFDLDGVEPRNVQNFFSAARFGVYPYPNYVVESGHGLHLYYLLDEPVDLYPNIKTQLKELKYSLTRLIWNRYTSTYERVQFQGINQGFRAPGSKTKIEGVRAQAWEFSKTPFALENLNEFAVPEARVDVSKRWAPTRMTLEEAKTQYPQWYERVIERGERRQWKVKPALYEWWLRLLHEQLIPVGHRYFAIMSLAIFAAKCGIYDTDKVRADAVALIPHLSSIDLDNPVTETDVDSALECLDSRYVTFPRKDVEKITGIRIDPNKRNYQKQADHLEEARALRDIRQRRAGTHWTDGNSRKGIPNKRHPKREAVLKWRVANPEGTPKDCISALGISKNTVYKWWNA